MSNTDKFQAAYVQYRTAQVAAERLHDPELTDDANRERKAQARAKAREALRNAIPQRPEGPDPRDAVTDALAPTTADGIAVLAHQRAKVDALLDAGRNILQVIDQADETRLAAILDAAETSPAVLASPDPEGAQAELRGRVFQRLASLGHPEAQQAAAAAAERDLTTAWADVLEGIATGSEPGYGPRAVIYQQDPEAYPGTLGMNLPTDEARTVGEADRSARRDHVLEQADQASDRMGADL